MYVQYAHARTYSVFRNAHRDLPDLDVSEAALRTADLSLLATPEELELIRTVGSWPRQVAAAARAHEPHRLAFYLHELAAQLRERVSVLPAETFGVAQGAVSALLGTAAGYQQPDMPLHMGSYATENGSSVTSQSRHPATRFRYG